MNRLAIAPPASDCSPRRSSGKRSTSFPLPRLRPALTPARAWSAPRARHRCPRPPGPAWAPGCCLRPAPLPPSASLRLPSPPRHMETEGAAANPRIGRADSSAQSPAAVASSCPPRSLASPTPLSVRTGERSPSGQAWLLSGSHAFIYRRYGP